MAADRSSPVDPGLLPIDLSLDDPSALPAPLTDCHAHLGDPVFDDDRDAVLERAAAAGVERVVMVGETLGDARRNLELSERYPGRLPVAAGLYPTVLDEEQAIALADLVRDRRDRIAAIGEVGLDRWKVRDDADLELQRRLFALFVDLAIELDLPLNVHSRSAGHYAIELLLERGARKVQLHAFDGKASRARPAVAAGYFFSVPPSVVRSKQKQKLVRALPLEQLLVETDSPVLGVDRTGRNEPAAARISLRAIAWLKELEEARVAEEIARNTSRLYPDLVGHARR